MRLTRHLTGLLVIALVLTPRVVGAQEVTIDFGDQGSLTLRSIQLFALVTILSLAPGLAIMVTCFPFLVTVFSILRQAIGLQQAPPNMMIVSLAMFLTYFVMEPVFMDAWSSGIDPLVSGTIGVEDAFQRTMDPFRQFMSARVDPDTIKALTDARPTSIPAHVQNPEDLSVLVPAFLLSEVARAFQIGFLIFLPFLIIDLVVAAVLMSMGMMMVPPAIVSLPFKLAFFVIADGWSLLSGALVRSYM
jgi:flagellar biosynthetic protein FliP